MAEHRKKLKRRSWHAVAAGVAAAAVLAGIDAVFLRQTGRPPILWDTWKVSIWLPLLAGAAAAKWAGGWQTPRRIILGVLTGLGVAIAYSGVNNVLAIASGAAHDVERAVWMAVWACFVFGLLATAAAIVTELRTREPAAKAAEPAGDHG